MPRLFVTFLLLLGCAAHAADDPKMAAARRLVELLQIDGVYEDSSRACRDGLDVADYARRVYEANRDAYGGLSPRSGYWPEVVAAYGRYRAEACQATTVQTAKEVYAQVFARRLSQAELEHAADAMATPEGQALQAASREASRLLSIAQNAEQERSIAAASKRYRDSIQEIVRRHEADPR